MPAAAPAEGKAAAFEVTELNEHDLFFVQSIESIDQSLALVVRVVALFKFVQQAVHDLGTQRHLCATFGLAEVHVDLVDGNAHEPSAEPHAPMLVFANGRKCLAEGLRGQVSRQIPVLDSTPHKPEHLFKVVLIQRRKQPRVALGGGNEFGFVCKWGVQG